MDLICVAMRGRVSACLTPRRAEYGKQIRKKYEAGEVSERKKNIQQLEPRTDSNDGSSQLRVREIRRFTPTECARLQTIPDWYKWECSDTQQYRMLGNGWTVDVIAHILSFIKDKLNINVV